MTSKGQVNIPKSVRQHLGLSHGARMAFVVEGDHAVLRPAVPAHAIPKSGFGRVKVGGPGGERAALKTHLWTEGQCHGRYVEACRMAKPITR